MSEVRAIQIHDAVFQRFEGVAPTHRGEINLSEIIVAVVEELERLGIVDLEIDCPTCEDAGCSVCGGGEGGG